MVAKALKRFVTGTSLDLGKLRLPCISRLAATPLCSIMTKGSASASTRHPRTSKNSTFFNANGSSDTRGTAMCRVSPSGHKCRRPSARTTRTFSADIFHLMADL